MNEKALEAIQEEQLQQDVPDDLGAVLLPSKSKSKVVRWCRRNWNKLARKNRRLASEAKRLRSKQNTSVTIEPSPQAPHPQAILLQTRLRVAREETEKQQRALRNQHKELETLKRSLQQKEEEYFHLKKELEELQLECQFLKNKLGQREEECERLLKDKIEPSIAMNQKQDKLVQENAQLQKTVNQLQEQQNRDKALIEQLTKENTSLKDQANKARGELEESAKKIGELETRLANHTAIAEVLESLTKEELAAIKRHDAYMEGVYEEKTLKGYIDFHREWTTNGEVYKRYQASYRQIRLEELKGILHTTFSYLEINKITTIPPDTDIQDERVLVQAIIGLRAHYEKWREEKIVSIKEQGNKVVQNATEVINSFNGILLNATSIPSSP